MPTPARPRSPQPNRQRVRYFPVLNQGTGEKRSSHRTCELSIQGSHLPQICRVGGTHSKESPTPPQTTPYSTCSAVGVQQGSHRSHRDGVDDRILDLVVQRIDRSTAKTAGQSGLDSGQRLQDKKRAAPSHTRTHTHTRVQSECTHMGLGCNHSDEITLQPALDHLTLAHSHTPTHTFVTFIYK